MNLCKINLNLLVALDALLTERQVTRAAKKTFVTQSAMSIALSQLRELLHDDLLVRGPQGMTPTPRAIELQPQLHEILQTIKEIVYTKQPFNPKTEKSLFKIGMSDYAELVCLPALSKIMAEEAPNISLKVIHLNSLDEIDVFEKEQLVLAVGVLSAKKTPLLTECIFRDHGVCVARKGHPLMKGELTLERFLQAKHIATHLQRDPTLSRIDQILKQLGAKRKIALTLPHIIAALHLVKQTDYLLASVNCLAEILAKPLGLEVRELPFATNPLDILLAWPQQYDKDPAQQWLRNTIRKATRKM